MAKGLDDVHPFSDSHRVDVLLREADCILSSNTDTVGRKAASRIWGFMSKFSMLDRFSKTLSVAERYPGIRRCRDLCSSDCIGTVSKVSTFYLILVLFFIPIIAFGLY